MTQIAALIRAPRRDVAVVATALAAAAASLIVGAGVTDAGLVRIVAAVAALCLLVTVASTSPQLALYGLMTWLVALGLTRRLLTTFASSGQLGDPLLLVGPAAIAVLFLIAAERGALREQTRLSRAVLGLTILLALSVVNPLQGGLSVGLGGALLVIVPMLAFWVGRSLLDEDAVRGLVKLLGSLAFLAALYGLIQTFVGFPSWDQRWIEQTGYAALHVGARIRAFGTSSSAAEYAGLLAVGIISWRAIASRPSRVPVAIAAVTMIAVAVWFESARGIVVLIVAAVWFTVAAARQMSFRRAALVGLLLLAALPIAVGHLASKPASSTGASTTSALVAHQVEGLSNPLGHNSTLGLHLELVVNGVAEAVGNPIGRGVGATTIAASKFEGASGGSTEADPSNAAVDAGILGLVLYLLIATYGMGGAYRLARARRTVPAIAALGVLVVTFVQWLNGGDYAIAPLPWLFLGWIDATLLKDADRSAGDAASRPGPDSRTSS